MHHVWECQDNAKLAEVSSDAADTQHLAARAVRGEASLCLWTRGLVPADWVTTDKPENLEEHFWHFGDMELFGAGGR